MVSAWWLLVAAITGVSIGMLLTALLTVVAGKDVDDSDGPGAPHPAA